MHPEVLILALPLRPGLADLLGRAQGLEVLGDFRVAAGAPALPAAGPVPRGLG